jgi:hypothetical protein
MKPLKDLKQKLLENPEVKAEYDRLEPEFKLAFMLIEARSRAGLLSLLEQDIAHGRHVSALPDDLVKSLVTALEHDQSHDQEISGDVAL